MTLIACGRTNVNDRAEGFTRAMREAEGFKTDGGCGFVFDTDNPIQLARLYRCVECGRFLCKPCILAHFKEDAHAAATIGVRPTSETAQVSPTVERTADARPSEHRDSDEHAGIDEGQPIAAAQERRPMRETCPVSADPTRLPSPGSAPPNMRKARRHHAEPITPSHLTRKDTWNASRKA